MKNKNNGITLVVLIVTIVIMLILAAVAIGSINGGLFEYVGKAVSKTEISSIIDNLEKAKIIKETNNLNGTLSQVLGNEYSKYDSTFKIVNGKLVYMGEDTKIVAYLFELGQKEDSIENASVICTIQGHDFQEANYLAPKTCKRCGDTEGQKLVATAPHSNQQNSEDIGIGTDGQLVNLDNWTYVKESGTWRLTGYTGQYSEQGGIEGFVPQVIGGINVTSMAGTFKNNTNLVIAPEIPTTVKNMTEAFYGCTQLTQASLIPYGVTNVNKIFQGCSGLVTLQDGFTLPDSITGRNTMQVFYQCTNLKELPDSFRISNNSTTMFYMFYQCSNLEKLPEGFTIPNSVSEVLHAFDGCSKLSELPDSFRLSTRATECSYIFSNTGLTKLPDSFRIPEGYTTIEGMFKNCNLLEGLPDGFTLPSTLTSMYLGFQNCTKLVLPDNFTIPAGVKNTYYAFSNNYKIEGTITMLCDPTTNNFRMFYGTGTQGSGLTVYYLDTCTSISSIQSSSSASVTFVELPSATE